MLRSRERQAVAKPRQSAYLQPEEHVAGLVALWSKAGTSEAGARLCGCCSAMRAWMHPGAPISLRPFEWKLFRALFTHSYGT